MADNELIKAIPRWAKKIGRTPARLALISEGVGISTSEFLVRGEYRCVPGPKLTAKIRKAMGSFLASSKAS